MSSSKGKGGRSSAQNIETPGVRKIHSRHTWVKSFLFSILIISLVYSIEIGKYQSR